jgi:hypothetical protein
VTLPASIQASWAADSVTLIEVGVGVAVGVFVGVWVGRVTVSTPTEPYPCQALLAYAWTW